MNMLRLFPLMMAGLLAACSPAMWERAAEIVYA